MSYSLVTSRLLIFFGLALVAGWAASARADQQIADDLIVSANLCVGVGCVDGEAFDFDTVILKEDNLRLYFADTSVSTGFPNTHWRLLANDSARGGENRFSIEDVTAGTIPFTVMGSAPSHALFVDASGNVGVGTRQPSGLMHLLSGDTPHLRFGQSAALGWRPYQWDVGGNESNFFVRDAESGALPFRVLPLANNNSLVVGEAGIGIGQPAPQALLHLADDGAVAVVFEDTAAGILWRQEVVGDPGAGGTSTFSIGAGGQSPALTLDNGGNMTIAGILSQSSSRQRKRSIIAVDGEALLRRASQVAIKRWRYLDDTSDAEHLGPMAEDFHRAFGLGPDNAHIAASDIAGVALASTTALHRLVDQQEQEIARLRQESADLRWRLDAIEARLSRVE